MKYSAKELVNLFKDYPEDEVIFMWFKAREEFDGVIDISEEQWSEIEDSKDWIYDYVNTAMFDLVCEKVDKTAGQTDQLGAKPLWSNEVLDGCSKIPLVSKTKE